MKEFNINKRSYNKLQNGTSNQLSHVDILKNRSQRAFCNLLLRSISGLFTMTLSFQRIAINEETLSLTKKFPGSIMRERSQNQGFNGQMNQYRCLYWPFHEVQSIVIIFQIFMFFFFLKAELRRVSFNVGQKNDLPTSGILSPKFAKFNQIFMFIPDLFDITHNVSIYWVSFLL